MITNKIFEQIRSHIDEVVEQQTELGVFLWQELLKSHPADIAEFLGSINGDDCKNLFAKFPEILKINVFEYLSNQ